ncbi:jg3408 [Pararge aegeria aegeria]|uniref:Jg3408 protein n=1 Tax=Pararge aegeria aegeria TaxID=348720 RepID=A0A8S4RSK8_9NEOP|nr:jg3408 [Pararge aegeria aegeria]
MKETMDQSLLDMNLKNLPIDSRRAVKIIVDSLLCSIYPLLSKISDKLHYQIKDEIPDEHFIQIRNVYTLCADQIKKCMIILFDVIKKEYHEGVYLQEARQFTIERICWCVQKLTSVEQLLQKPSKEISDSSNEFITVSMMYFVNWIDQTFDLLGKLTNVVSRNDFKKTEELSNEWKTELVECVCGLHTSVDELLLSAMTLCKHCLPADQYVVKARCQVVLRETKTLLNELIEGDSDTVRATIETLKLPIMPFNINVRIDVLKDVLYVLETNTNTALLALVVHCFSHDVPPVEILMKHFENSSKTCACVEAGDSNDDVTERCTFIKDFDLYNERLLQIGSFAMSCSSDQKRILNLRSGLASLEALDPHLVPAVMFSPRSHHACILTRTWRQEMMLIRDSVFLIVDPAAFADKARQMMHQSLLEIMKESHYDNNKICLFINMGCVINEFFEVYEKWEPDALTCNEQLAHLLKYLKKVQLECKIVSNLLSSTNEYKYDVKSTNKSTNPTIQQLIKRLKLLYTLVKRINLLYNPRENDDEFYEEPPDSKTYNKYATYVNSPKKQTNNLSKSVFARTNVRCSTGKFPLAILKNHLKTRNTRDLSFSLKLDAISDLSELKLNREPSILYYSLMKSKSSLRKVVLCKQRALPYEKTDINDKTKLESSVLERDSVMDDAMSLHITDVLNQINNLTFKASTATRRAFNSTVLIDKPIKNNVDTTKNVLKMSINNDATLRRIWNITVNSSAADIETTSNLTQPSEVNTLERINDLDLLESKLSDLKSCHTETSL